MCKHGPALLPLLAALSCTTGPTGNAPPVLSPLDPVQIKVGERKPIEVIATDDDGDEVRFSFQLTLFPGDPGKEFTYNQDMALPTGLSWQAGVGRAALHWGPSANHVGKDHRFTVWASDGNGGEAERSTTVTIFPGEVDDSGEPGAPRFSFHPNLVLDMIRSECLKARIRVEDPDSLEVAITLEDAPEGMRLKPTRPDGKEAELSWCPTRTQVEERTVWTFSVVADDAEHAPVKKKMSVVIRLRDGGGPASDCEGEPPSIRHAQLEEQRGTEDYPLEASITDSESSIKNAFVGYTWRDPENLELFVGRPLADTGGGAFLGAIPNVGKLEGADLTGAVRIYYYLCAVDDDDLDGERCDKPWCDPPESLYTFVAHPPGTGEGEGETSSCPDDAWEANDTLATARPLADTDVRGLVLCPGDEDWYSFAASAGDEVAVRIYFHHDAGDLSLQLVDPSGAVAARAEDAADTDVKEAVVASAVAGTYVIGVTGKDVALAGATYELGIEAHAGGGGGECGRDPGEPNDGPEAATALQAGQHGPFAICGAEDPADWYSLQLDAGSAVSAAIRFIHSNQGDLDLYLFSEADPVAALARSDTLTDDESLRHTVAAAGRYLLAVKGYRGATNTYRLELAVSDGGGGGECPADDGGREPNDSAAQASLLEGDVECARLTAAGGQSEADWYGVVLDPFEGFTTTFAFTHAAGDLDLELLAADGVTVVDRSVSGTDDEAITFPGTPEGGEWYLRLGGYLGAQNDYAVRYRALPFGPGDACLADRLEPNNEQAEARFLVPGPTGELDLVGLSACGNEDWYRATVPAGKTLLAELAYGAGRGALDMRLLDSDGAEAGIPSPAGNTVLVDTDQPGTYFLRVLGVAGASNLYDLTLIVE